MDYGNLPEDLVKKIKQWDENSPSSKQFRELQKVASLVSDLKEAVQSSHKEATQTLGKTLGDLIAVTTEMRDREDPDQPDYAAPVVAAVEVLKKELMSAITGIEVNPQYSPQIDVTAPNVQVDVPAVDLSKLEKVLKTDLPKAFKQAIDAMPQPEPVDNSEVVGLLTEVTQQLSSIDTASRMKPQFPTTLKVTNPDGSTVSGSGLTDDELRATPVPTLTKAKTFVSVANSTTTPLTAGGVFNGDWEDVSEYDFLSITVLTDVDSAIEGAILHLSTNSGASSTRPVPQTITGGAGTLGFVVPISGYNAFKVAYTNNPNTAQSYFQVRIIAQNGANPVPIVPIGTVLKANDGAVLTNVAHNSYTSYATTVTGSGNNIVITPDSGKRMRLYYIALSADASNTAAVTVITKFGASGDPIYKLSLLAGSMFARNVGAGRHYVEGAIDESLYINLSAAVNGVHVSVEYEQY